MIKRIDLGGRRFGKLLVIDYSGNRYWNCLCDCGNYKTIRHDHLLNGDTRSCGCLRHKDLARTKFNKLLVISRSDKPKNVTNRSFYWRCLCDCGNYTIASTNALKRGRVKSCGCLKHKDRYIDITGQRFSRLLVIKKFDKTDGNVIRWLCQCDCGKTKIISGQSLKSGLTKSCGCLSIEKTTKRNQLRKGHNKYDLAGTYGIGYDSKGKIFYFDLDDYDKIKNYRWYVTKKGYVASSYLPSGSKKDGKISIAMHRIITNCIDKKLVPDHINHINYDNRKSNLRVVTYSQNNQNKIIYKKNTSSGRMGVCWQKSINKWYSYININKRRINLGYYEKLDDAIKARELGEIEYFKKYRCGQPNP